MGYGKNIDVRRVRSSLVATLSKANPPLIWRFDLDRNHSFTLALQGQDNEWELGVTSLKGEFNPIARFPLREDAEEALAAIGGQLSKGRLSWVLGLLKFLAILTPLLFLAVLGWAFLARNAARHQHMTPARALQEQGQVQPDSTQETPAPAPPPVKSGIPLPANEVLQPPPP